MTRNNTNKFIGYKRIYRFMNYKFMNSCTLLLLLEILTNEECFNGGKSPSLNAEHTMV